MTLEVLPFGHQFGIFDATGAMVAGSFTQRAWALKRRRLSLQDAGLIDPTPEPGVRRKCMCCPAQFASDGPHTRAVAVARFAVEPKIKLAQALKPPASPRVEDTVEAEFKALRNGWTRASKAARDRFISTHWLEIKIAFSEYPGDDE